MGHVSAVSLVGGVRHPKIYLYTTDAHKDAPWEGAREGTGLVKVGYTERDVNNRVNEQLNPVKSPNRVEPSWVKAEAAVTDDGLVFRDHEVHQALVKAGVHRREGEWFEATPDEILAAIKAIKSGRTLNDLRHRADFGMRPEQERAVEQTMAYFQAKAGDGRPPHFLWNAKMRFGKTFTAYQLAKRMGWKRILVLTYKPAVAGAWREDLLGHVDFEGWRFHGKDDDPPDLDDPSELVWFASFQDALGKDENGQPKAKNLGLYDVDWDVVIIDEYHFGAWRDAARSLYLPDAETGSEGDPSEKDSLDTPDLDEDFTDSFEEANLLNIGHYLYLSGTPFRALTQGQFLEDAVYNWTYSDEQREKTQWQGPGPNIYAALPKMHLLAYEMPDALKEVARNNASEFSLTEFFRTRKEGGKPIFLHQAEVQRWLNLLRGQDITGLWNKVSNNARPPKPYEDTNLLRALQHTIWYMPSVDACYAMRDLLEAQENVFYRDYTVVVAAGNEAGMGEKALPPVLDAIGRVPQDSKTITLTCAKLMTGVTVPAWTGILMLQEIKSPEAYFQAAFRVQSPWASRLMAPGEGGEVDVIHKEQCYVLDFSPNRALRQIVDYATRLRSESVSERDDEAAIREFMEFLPVLSFDGASMTPLQAGDVLDYLMTGVSSSALARRWNSPELITLTPQAMAALLANQELLASLEQIERFATITNDLTAMISTNKELRQKTLAKEKLTKDETKKKKDAAKRRANLKENLQAFVARIPLFMYLTDDREKAVRDIIEQVEPELFEKVTGLTIEQFSQLLAAKVFDDRRMDDAVWKFRDFEAPSLSYDENAQPLKTVGGWVLRRDERLARLIDEGVLAPGDVLTGPGGEQGVITEDYGIAVGGIRCETPDAAADTATGQVGTRGWGFWTVHGQSLGSLQSGS